jgi:hypothetical protein
MTEEVGMILGNSQPFAIYYKPNGEAVRLPADPWSRGRYLRRGFKLTPPLPSDVVKEQEGIQIGVE